MLASIWITGTLKTIAAWRKTQDAQDVANEAAEGTQIADLAGRLLYSQLLFEPKLE
jgi:hypothetical protein